MAVTDPYPEDDDDLRARLQLAFHHTYSFAEAASVSSKVHFFDTHDGFRVTLIKIRDPNAFPFEQPVLHVGIQGFKSAIQPATHPGRLALAARLLIRLGLGELLSKPLDSKAVGPSTHVWYLPEQWIDHPDTVPSGDVEE